MNPVGESLPGRATVFQSRPTKPDKSEPGTAYLVFFSRSFYRACDSFMSFSVNYAPYPNLTSQAHDHLGLDRASSVSAFQHTPSLNPLGEQRSFLKYVIAVDLSLNSTGLITADPYFGEREADKFISFIPWLGWWWLPPPQRLPRGLFVL